MSSRTPSLRRALPGVVVAVAARSLTDRLRRDRGTPGVRALRAGHLESTGPEQLARVILTEEAQHRVRTPDQPRPGPRAPTSAWTYAALDL